MGKIIYTLNEHIFDDLTEEGAYWLGMLASDGSVNKDRNTITLCLKAEDREHIQKFIKFMDFSGEEKFKWGTCKGKKYPNYYVSITRKELKKSLLKYGIVPNKSNSDIDFLKYIPENLKLHFIFGYLDGDGTISEPNVESDLVGTSKVEILGNFTLLLSMHYYLKNVYNIDSTIIKHKKNKYQLNIRHYQDLELLFFKYISCPCVLDRKNKRAKLWYDKLKNYKPTKRYKKVKVKFIKQCQCQCCGVEIDNRSTYCVECGHKMERKVERPTREVLKEEIRNNSFLALSKKYGVSDNAIRKWCKFYNLPYQATEIKKISNSDWVQI